jgi:hypothetical protein
VSLEAAFKYQYVIRGYFSYKILSSFSCDIYTSIIVSYSLTQIFVSTLVSETYAPHSTTSARHRIHRPPPIGQQPLLGRASSLLMLHDYTHLDTPHSVGLLWTSDQPNAETSTWQYTTHTRHRQPYPRRDSNPQATADPCLRPRGQWDRQTYACKYSSSLILTSPFKAQCQQHVRLSVTLNIWILTTQHICTVHLIRFS